MGKFLQIVSEQKIKEKLEEIYEKRKTENNIY